MLTTNPFDDDKLREECGIFGVTGADGAAALTALGLHFLVRVGSGRAVPRDGSGTLSGSRARTRASNGAIRGYRTTTTTYWMIAGTGSMAVLRSLSATGRRGVDGHGAPPPPASRT